MTAHLIELLIESESDPEQIDWPELLHELLPPEFEVQLVAGKTFSHNDVEHEIHWWITRRLTVAEWEELDNAESEVLTRIVGDGSFQGTAGPIPEEP